MYYSIIQTPLGSMIACASDSGVCLLEFAEDGDLPGCLERIRKQLNANLFLSANIHLRQLQEELSQYFNGSNKQFSVSLDLKGTDFQKSVWRSLLRIPFGATRSYAQQSKTMGNPKGIRAIATANGKNKIAIVVPCHRVIGSDGSLTGYAGGLNRKKWLLDHERKWSNQPVQQNLDFH